MNDLGCSGHPERPIFSLDARYFGRMEFGVRQEFRLDLPEDLRAPACYPCGSIPHGSGHRILRFAAKAVENATDERGKSAELARFRDKCQIKSSVEAGRVSSNGCLCRLAALRQGIEPNQRGSRGLDFPG
jgi:hypothetical protein